MKFAQELLDLQAGDSIVGGTFMQALDPEEIVWTCVSPVAGADQSIIFDVSWLGIDLGRFRLTAKGMERLEHASSR